MSWKLALGVVLGIISVVLLLRKGSKAHETRDQLKAMKRFGRQETLVQLYRAGAIKDPPKEEGGKGFFYRIPPKPVGVFLFLVGFILVLWHLATEV